MNFWYLSPHALIRSQEDALQNVVGRRINADGRRITQKASPKTITKIFWSGLSVLQTNEFRRRGHNLRRPSYKFGSFKCHFAFVTFSADPQVVCYSRERHLCRVVLYFRLFKTSNVTLRACLQNKYAFAVGTTCVIGNYTKSACSRDYLIATLFAQRGTQWRPQLLSQAS